MSHAVTEAMIESYALMILVMSTFFVYFCGMVWAFCNPKLSGLEEEEEEEEEGEDTLQCQSDTGKTNEVSLEQFFAFPAEMQGSTDWWDLAPTAELPWAHSCGDARFVEQSPHSCYINSSYDVD